MLEHNARLTLADFLGARLAFPTYATARASGCGTRYPALCGTSPLRNRCNSSSAGLLSVGAQGSIAAVIIAPGSPLAGQAGRPGNSAADYLEGRNADAIANDFEDAQPSAVFNDRLLSVSRDELFAKVSPRIVAEIAGRLQPVPIAQPLLDYSAAHGGLFPWADTDNDGQQDSAATSGKVPYLDLTFPVLVGIDVEDVLKDNGWFSIASYDLSIDQSSATLSVGSATRNLP